MQTDFGARAFLAHLSGDSWTPTTMYLAAHTSPPGPGGQGDTVGDRLELSMAAAVGGSIATSAEELWSPLDASDAHLIVGFSTWTASTGGEMFDFVATPGFLVQPGRPLAIAAGGLTIEGLPASTFTEATRNAWLDLVYRGTSWTPGQLSVAPYDDTESQIVTPEDVDFTLPDSGRTMSADAEVSWGELDDTDPTDVAYQGLLDGSDNLLSLSESVWEVPAEVGLLWSADQIRVAA